MGQGASISSNEGSRRASAEESQGTSSNSSNRRWSCCRDKEVADVARTTDAPAADVQVRASVDHQAAVHAGQEPLPAESQKLNSTPDVSGAEDVQALARPKSNLLQNSPLEVTGQRNNLLPAISGNLPDFFRESFKRDRNKPAASSRRPRRSNMGAINIAELIRNFRDRHPTNKMLRRNCYTETNVMQYCRDNSFINTQGVVSTWPTPPLHVPAPVLDTQLVYSGLSSFLLAVI